MMKIILLLSLCAAAIADGDLGGRGLGWGQGGLGLGGLHGGAGLRQGLGHGGIGGGYGGLGLGGLGGRGGWGWRRHYVGWANVKAHQTPYNYNFAVQENGKGYSKWVSQGAETHHVVPVFGKGWGLSG